MAMTTTFYRNQVRGKEVTAFLRAGPTAPPHSLAPSPN